MPGLNMMRENEVEHTDCPLCFSREKRIVYQLAKPFRVARCEACGFHYLDPRIEEDRIAEYYGGDYFNNEQVGYSDYTFQEESLRLTFRRFLKALHARGLTGGALLEIGAGYGFLLDEARDYFSFRAGTELSSAASQQAAKSADLLVHGGVDDLDKESRFNCIIMSQVIEHIYRPGEFIERIKHYLLPDGKLIIITPDFGNIWRKIMGAGWPSFKVPEHVLYFDSESLRRFLTASGFARISSLPYPHAFPLKLVAAKLNMTLPERLDKVNVWLPRTCLAISASTHD